MDYFKGLNDQERYSNAVLNEMRRSNQLLEQIAQMLQSKVEKPEKLVKRTRRKVS